MGNAWWVDSIAYVNKADQEMAALDSIKPDRWAVADTHFKDILGAATPHQVGDTIVETGYAPNRLTYKSHSAQGGLAVFSEIYFPWGWTATIDGKEAALGRVNYVLRALQIPAGDHTIEMSFHPIEVTASERVATTAIILIFIALLLAANFALLRHLRAKKQ